jgi:UDP-N-acetylmuramoyl-tripeptide--D-alanyl-D-alanine ligase
VSSIVTFGERPGADFRLVAIEMTTSGSRIVADVRGTQLEFEIAVPLRGMALNALGVLATIQAAGGEVARAAADLREFQAVDGRAQVLSIPIRGGTATLLNDSFNATPLSIASALELLASVPLGPGGRRLAAFGDIHHLGSRSAEIHADLAATLARYPLDRLFTHGELMRHLNRSAPASLVAPHADSLQELYRQIRAELRPGDAITLKASTNVGLAQLARALRKDRERL